MTASSRSRSNNKHQREQSHELPQKVNDAYMMCALVENDYHCARQRNLLATALEHVVDSKSNFVLNSHYETMLSYGTNIEAMD